MSPIEEIERPPSVAEAEWQDTGQIGAAYAHTYYPAFLDVPPASAFVTPINRKPIYIHVVRQLKALEVTDFDNTLMEKEAGELRLPVIRKPINGVEVGSVSATGGDAWGGVGIVIAQEQSLTGKIFRNTPFTEIIIGWEIRHILEANTHDIFYKALRRLLCTYRYITPDLRAKLVPALTAHVPTIRRGLVCAYKKPRAPIALDRLRENEPLSWRLDTLSIKEYVAGVAAHYSRFGDLEGRATNIGSYLMDGFVLPETAAALEAVAEQIHQSSNYRIAVVEAISLIELSILAAWRRLSSHIKTSRDINASDGHTLKFLSEKLLPILLSFYEGNRGPLLRRLKDALQIRHRVVHEGYRPDAGEADKVLSIVRTLILILEIPSKYKQGWQLKPGLLEPVPIEP